MHHKIPARTLSAPLFESNLRRPNIQVDVFVILNVLIVIGLFLLLSNKLFLPAGIGIELPDSEYIQRAAVSHAITIKAGVKDNKLLILDDSVSSINSLKTDLQARDIQEKKQDYNAPILLRVDRSTSLDTIIKISNIVHDAGYTRIQLALNKSN